MRRTFQETVGEEKRSESTRKYNPLTGIGQQRMLLREYASMRLGENLCSFCARTGPTRTLRASPL
jgi:hypothetical protein